MTTLTRHSLIKCRTKDCPFTPDEHDEWMELCSRAPEHGHRHDQPTHQHHPKKGMGGNNPLSKIVAVLCWPFHDQIDNGEWGNSVDETFEDGKRVTMYRAWDVHNKTVIEQVIGIATKEESDETVGRNSADSGVDIAVGDNSAASGTRRRAQGGSDSSLSVGDTPASGPHSAALTHEQRVAIARHIKDAKQRSPFFAGDTANLWEEELGEDFWNIYANEFGYTYPSLRNVMRVCKRIPPNQRHDEMSFAHHEATQTFDIETRDAWLERSLEEEWPVKRLREELVSEGLLTAQPKTRKWSLGELRAAYENWQGKGGEFYTPDFFDWLGEQA